MRRIWLCYASFGGGHRSPARALEEALQAEYGPAADVQLVDVTDFLPSVLKKMFCRWYDRVVGGRRLGYTLGYAISFLSFIRAAEHWVARLVIERRLAARLTAERPDAVIFFYPFYTSPLIAVIRRHGGPFMATVVTDPFSPHPLWFSSRAIPYVVCSPQARERARARGISPEQIHEVPFLLRSQFLRQYSRAEVAGLKRSLALEPALPVVLLGGSGVSFKQFRRAAEALLSLAGLQLVVVCGENTSEQRAIEALAACHPGRKVLVFGFVEAMHELYAVADIVIGKAGASFTMEALAQSKPLILIDYIWGQEKGTVEFVVQNRLGWFEPNLKRVAALVRRLLANPAERSALAERLSAHPAVSGAPAVARWVKAELEKREASFGVAACPVS